MPCALATQACRLVMTLLFLRLPSLLEDLAVSHGDASFRKRLCQLTTVDLRILDDFGLAALNAFGRNDMLEIIESRLGAMATLDHQPATSGSLARLFERRKPYGSRCHS